MKLIPISHVKMADAFGEEDIFSVFEENSSSNSSKKKQNDKRDTNDPSASEVSADITQVGEKRQFKPDVIDLALDETGTKKAKFDDLER